MKYAGFWARFLACIIDGIILGIIYGLIVMILGDVAGILSLLIGWLYFALMESSEKQATLGKQALGIRVTDLSGNRIGFGQATGRYFGKIISGLILYIGYIMAGFTEKKQALHDIMAGCLVTRHASEFATASHQSSHKKHHRAFDLDDAFDSSDSSSDSGGGDGGGGSND